MKMLICTGLSVDLWGALMLTGFHLDFVLLIFTLRAEPVFNPPLCLLLQPIYEQLLYEDLTEDSVKSLTDIQAENIHCSPLIQLLI